METRHRRDRALRQRRREARWPGDARQRLWVAHGGAAADVRRVRRGAAPLLRARHRVLRGRPLHVRVELPGRPHVALVPRAVERLEEDRARLLTRREGRVVRGYCDTRVPPRGGRGRMTTAERELTAPVDLCT